MRVLFLYPSLLAIIVAVPVSSQNPISLKQPDALTAEFKISAEPSQHLPLPATGSSDADFVKMGDQLLAARRYHEAIDMYRQISTPSARALDCMGIAYESLLDSDDAIRSYKKALRLDPKNARTNNDLATAYDQVERHSDAEHLYRKAIQLAPSTALYYKNLGTNLLAQHKYRKGAEAYQHALSLDPHIFDKHGDPLMVLPRSENAELNYARAGSCAQAGLRDCALTYLRKAINEGSATARRIESDRSFTSLRDDPSMQQLLADQR